MSLSLSTDLRGMLVQAGDVLRYSAPEIGLDAREFEVIGWQLGASADGKALTARLDLADYDSAMFEWNPETDVQPMARGETLTDTTVSNFLDNVFYQETVTGTEGTFAASYLLTWTPPELDGLDLANVFAAVTVTMFFEDGTAGEVETSATVTGGSATLNVSLDITGKVYTRHVVAAFARAKLSDNTLGPDQEAEPVVV